MNKERKKIAIIGAGPAGMAAALQLKYFGVDFILFEKNKKGSLLKNAWLVRNYLGVCPGKEGPELLQQFRSHLTKNKIKIKEEGVELLDYNSRTKLFKIKTAKKVYEVDHVIVAAGTKSKLLIENPPPDISSSLFYDVLPLLKKRKKKILIIGAGDAAFDNALNLAVHNEVIICNRAKKISALPFLVTSADKNRNISYLEGYKLCNIAVSSPNKKLGLMFLNKGKRVCLEVDCLLAAIGRLPQKDFYAAGLEKKEKKLIKEGRLFLVGDVKNDIYRQVAIAVGDGVRVAMQIFNDIRK